MEEADRIHCYAIIHTLQLVAGRFFELTFCVGHGLRLGLYWLGCLLQKSVEVAPFEQSISVRRIPVHRNVTTRRPFAKRVVMDAQIFRCLSSMHVISQVGHALVLLIKRLKPRDIA